MDTEPASFLLRISNTKMMKAIRGTGDGLIVFRDTDPVVNKTICQYYIGVQV